MTTPSTATAPNGGFILIPVLATLGLLSLIALALSKTTIVDVRMVASQLRLAEAEALADGASRLAIQRIISDRAAGRRVGSNTGDKSDTAFPVDGRSFACGLPAATAVITAQDVGGLVDLNTAPQALFDRLFTGVGLAKEDAASLAAALIDFRDPDDRAVLGGGEAAEYRAAGLPFGPKNAPFSSVNELDQVLGMTPAVMTRIRPLVTVSSMSRGVDLNVASQQLRDLDLPKEFAVATTGRAFMLRVTAVTDLRVSFTREVVFEPNSTAALGFVITDWRSSASIETAAGAELPSCRDLARRE